MIKIIFLISVLYQTAWAQNSQIVNCQVDNSEFSATVSLDAIGAGFLSFKKADQNKIYQCNMRLTYIGDLRKAISPSLKFRFELGACDSDLAALKQMILSKITLLIDIRSQQKPMAILQWLRTKQPESCDIKKLSIFDVAENSKKWNDRTWGRRATASEFKPQK